MPVIVILDTSFGTVTVYEVTVGLNVGLNVPLDTVKLLKVLSLDLGVTSLTVIVAEVNDKPYSSSYKEFPKLTLLIFKVVEQAFNPLTFTVATVVKPVPRMSKTVKLPSVVPSVSEVTLTTCTHVGSLEVTIPSAEAIFKELLD